MFRTYLKLIKPGIVAGNLVAVTGGYFLGSSGDIRWITGMLVAISVALVISSACAANNIVDRDIDALMARTRDRPLVKSEISTVAAKAIVLCLGIGGVALLYAATGQYLPAALILVGYAVYVGLYTSLLKRKSVYGTLAGSLSGAIPPVVGYCSASGQFDAAAITLLVMFSLWQMPHSYAIAIFRAADYQAASIPVYPAIKGWPAAKRQMAGYIAAFSATVPVLSLLGYAGPIYLVPSLAIGLYWLRLAFQGFSATDEVQWARKIFISSIAVIVVLNVAMALTALSIR
jgi:protoheme IX farnesyltransferase